MECGRGNPPVLADGGGEMKYEYKILSLMGLGVGLNWANFTEIAQAIFYAASSIAVIVSIIYKIKNKGK